MSRRRIAFTVLGLLIASACGHETAHFDVASAPLATTTTQTSAPRAVVAVSTSTTARAAARRPATVPATVKGSQAIVVTAAKYGATTATLTAYTRTATGWKVALGPWSAWVGSKGIAPAGAKREGDGRTPTGTYGIDFMFGVESDPGVKFSYRVVTGPNIVWVEDPNSPNYNRWVDSNTEDIGNQADSMYKPQYGYGAVIAYNTAARTPGLGSGIFFHISRNRPSAGCITLPVDQLLAMLRWLDPSASPAVVIRVGT